MSEILEGNKAIATYLHVSVRSVQRLRHKYPDMPIAQSRLTRKPFTERVRLLAWLYTVDPERADCINDHEEPKGE